MVSPPSLWTRLLVAAGLLAIATAFGIDHVKAVPGLAAVTNPLATLLAAAFALWGRSAFRERGPRRWNGAPAACA